MFMTLRCYYMFRGKPIRSVLSLRLASRLYSHSRVAER